MTNFRTAKYMPDGTAIDDPNELVALSQAQILSVLLAQGAGAVGFKNDGRAVYDAGAAAANPGIVNSASAAFKASDVGKLIAITPRTRNNTYWRYGTILGVNSPTQVLTNMNITITYTNATCIFGSDDSAAFASALANRALSGGGAVHIFGLTCVKGAYVVPNGVWLEGSGAITPPNGIGNIFYAGSTLVRMDAITTDPFITLGATEATNNRSAGAYGLTIEGLDMYGSLQGSGYGANVEQCCLLGPVNTGPSMSLLSNYIIHNLAPGAATQVVLRQGGDTKVKHNQIYGAGAGRAIVRIDGNGGEFSGNHIYAGDSAYAARLAGILVTIASGARGGNNIVSGNTIDSPYGPALRVEASGTQILSNLQFIGNNCYQNDLVPANTHPFIQLVSVVGSELRGLTIKNNNARSSWGIPTNGTWTHMVDHSAMLGTTTGVGIQGNECTDVVGNIYSSGATPTGVVSANNTIVKTTGVVVTG